MFVWPGPIILHADVDAFFASVEQRDDPELKGRPVIVGTGVVMAASYEARAHGVHSGMGGARARRLCPQAIVAESRWSVYIEASRAVFAVFERTAPLVERLSIEEAFLDIGGLVPAAGSPHEIAKRLRDDVREQVGLPITGGRRPDERPRPDMTTRRMLRRAGSCPARMYTLLIQPPNLDRPTPYGPFDTAMEATRFEDDFREAHELPHEETEGLWRFDVLPLSTTVGSQFW